jgi:hypothetical protein
MPKDLTLAEREAMSTLGSRLVVALSTIASVVGLLNLNWWIALQRRSRCRWSPL